MTSTPVITLFALYKIKCNWIEIVQGFRHLRVNLIHFWYLPTAWVSSTRKLGKASSESSDLSTEGVMLKFRRSTKCFFYRPTISPVKVSSSLHLVKHSGQVPAFPPESSKGLPLVPFHVLRELLTHLRFCFHNHIICIPSGLPISVCWL